MNVERNKENIENINNNIAILVPLLEGEGVRFPVKLTPTIKLLTFTVSPCRLTKTE